LSNEKVRITNRQIPNLNEIPMTKYPRLELGTWKFIRHWNLVIGNLKLNYDYR